MARPKSDDKRTAILAAAVRRIDAEGLGVSTAAVAKDAGVASGTLFTYFRTKAELLNTVYLETKGEMAAAALKGYPAEAELRKQVLHVWTHWTAWAAAHPAKRRVLARLGVSDEITAETRAAVQREFAVLAEMMRRIREGGHLRNAPMPFVAALMTSHAETTMDAMIGDPANAKKYCKFGFEAFWRAMA